MSFISELKRRNVIRMAGVYLVGAWLIVQVAGTVLPMFGAPEWLPRSIVVLLALGFVPTLVFSWLYELTPDGLKREKEVPREQSITSRTAHRMDRLIVIGLGAVVALIAADRYWPRTGGSISQSTTGSAMPAVPSPAKGLPASRAPATPQSIAVLPFADLSPAKDQEYFADGIAEEILNALTRIPTLKVVGRTSSFKFRDAPEDLRVIGEQLGVSHILEGSVRKQADQVRITAELVRTDDGFRAWSNTYERRLDDIFVIQDDISHAIAVALSIQLSDITPHRREGSADPRAHELYLRARQLMAQRSGGEVIQAAALFEAATEIDPTLDMAYSGRALLLSIAWAYAPNIDVNELSDEAQRSVERALALNPVNAEAHSVLAFIHSLRWRWDEALQETQLAIDLSPNDAEVANFAGDSFRIVADFNNAMKWEQYAVELDPLSSTNLVDVAWLFLEERRCDQAVAPLEQAMNLDPGSSVAHYALARAYVCLHEPAKARAVAERLEHTVPNAPFLPELQALVAVSEGRAADARATLGHMELQAGDASGLTYGIAQMYAMLGDYGKAAPMLERAYAGRDPGFIVDELFILPEDWPDDPTVRTALDKPELNALYEIRRRNLAEHPRAGGM